MILTRSTRCCDSNTCTCSSILSQEYIYNKWFHYYREIRLSTLIIITNEVVQTGDALSQLTRENQLLGNVTKTS